MKQALLMTAAAVGLLGASASGAMAQAGGSYLRTCTDVDRDGRGNYRPTQIDTRSCGRFGNSNGRLVCEGGRPRGDDGGGYDRGGGGGGYDRGGGGYDRPRSEGYGPPRY